MNDQSDLQLRIFEAKSLLRDLPVDLPALQIGQRAPVGPTVRLCAVGDIGLSGRAAITAKRRTSNMLFAEIAPVLRAADITFGNLESPLASEIAPGNMFAAPVAGATTLRDAGFTILHLANNHVGEYGQAGLAATLKGVRDAGITPLGAADDLSAAMQLVRTDRHGLRIGWLGCGRTLLSQEDTGPRYWELNEQEVLAAIAEARSDLDVLILSAHIGLMFLDYPDPEHKSMAERLMEAGADMILMHHAHVLQGVEITPLGRVCCYNLGNFLYDYLEVNVLTSVMLQEQQEGALFIFDLDRHGVTSLVILPTWIDADCRVRWALQSRGEKILRRLQRVSLGLKANYHREFDRQRVERNFWDTLRILFFHARRGNWSIIRDMLLRIRLEHVGQAIRYAFGRLVRHGGQ